MGPIGWIAVSAAVAAGWVLYGKKKKEQEAARAAPGAVPVPPGVVPMSLYETPPEIASAAYESYETSKDPKHLVGVEGTEKDPKLHLYYQIDYPVGNEKVPEGGYDSYHVFPNQPSLPIFVRKRRAGRTSQEWTKMSAVGSGDCSKVDFTGFYDRSISINEGPDSLKGTKFEYREVQVDRFGKSPMTDERYFMGSYKVRVDKSIGSITIFGNDGKECAYATDYDILNAVVAP